MAWTKVETSDTPTWDKEANNEIEGTYKGFKSVQTKVSETPTNLYTLTTKDGDVAVWGSAGIDFKMAEIAIGSKVKIVFNGKKVNPKSNRTYNDFDVFVDSSAAAPTPVVDANLDDIFPQS